MTTTTNAASWAETATAGEYLARHIDMTAEETEPGHYVVTHDASGGPAWEGAASSCDEAYELATSHLEGSDSSCGYSDSDLDEARRILRRGDMTLDITDRGIRAVRIDDEGAYGPPGRPLRAEEDETMSKYFAAVGNDGFRPVVWGLGESPEVALANAASQDEAPEATWLRTFEITPEAQERVEHGDVTWDEARDAVCVERA